MNIETPVLSRDPDGSEWLAATSRVAIYYEDTDFSGYVYHANYLKYFERGREDLLGLPFVKELYERGIHYVVARIDIGYHRPARHGDILDITTRLRLTESPITVCDHEAYIVTPTGRGPEKIVSARVKLACVGMDGKTQRVPADIEARLRALGSAAQ